jgi:hypothetical protein
VIGLTMAGLNGVEADAPFGSHADMERNWKGHDPAYLVTNLKGMGLWFATADGSPGVYDDPVTDPKGVVTAGGIESLTHVSTDRFLGHLDDAHIPYHDYDYGSGTHSWPYWARDLRKFLPTLMRRFAHPPAQPRPIHYVGIQTTWKEWGWRVAYKNTGTQEWGSIHRAHRGGFRLTGNRPAMVTTPRIFRTDSAYSVKVGKAQPVVKAATHRRLSIRVPLSATTGAMNVTIRRLQPGRQ